MQFISLIQKPYYLLLLECDISMKDLPYTMVFFSIKISLASRVHLGTLIYSFCEHISNYKTPCKGLEKIQQLST